MHLLLPPFHLPPAPSVYHNTVIATIWCVWESKKRNVKSSLDCSFATQRLLVNCCESPLRQTGVSFSVTWSQAYVCLKGPHLGQRIGVFVIHLIRAAAQVMNSSRVCVFRGKCAALVRITLLGLTLHTTFLPILPLPLCGVELQGPLDAADRRTLKLGNKLHIFSQESKGSEDSSVWQCAKAKYFHSELLKTIVKKKKELLNWVLKCSTWSRYQRIYWLQSTRIIFCGIYISFENNINKLGELLSPFFLVVF